MKRNQKVKKAIIALASGGLFCLSAVGIDAHAATNNTPSSSNYSLNMDNFQATTGSSSSQLNMDNFISSKNS